MIHFYHFGLEAAIELTVTVALPVTVAADAVASEPVAHASTFLTPFRLTFVIASLPSSFEPDKVLSCAPVCPNASASPLTVPPARFDTLLPFALRAASRATPAAPPSSSRAESPRTRPAADARRRAPAIMAVEQHPVLLGRQIGEGRGDDRRRDRLRPPKSSIDRFAELQSSPRMPAKLGIG